MPEKQEKEVMSGYRCPKCSTDLSETAVNGGVCPSCHSLIDVTSVETSKEILRTGKQPIPPEKRHFVFSRIIIGAVLLGIGLVSIRRFFLIGLLLIIAGVAAILKRLFPEGTIFSRITIRNIGLVMLILGIFPWIYTPLLIRDGGMEGSGMLGTLIFLFVGLPGLVLTLIGLFIE